MSIATFTDLMAAPVSDKVKLVEMEPSENIAGGVNWNLHGSYANVYYISYLTESVTLSTGEVSKITKEVSAMKANATSLTLVSSVNACWLNTSSFYHDTTNGVLYVNISGVSGSYTPETITVLLTTFTLRFASKAVTLSNYYYEPYVSNAPTISQTASDLFSGRAETARANISFHNDGYWDRILYRFIWNNRKVTVKFGGESLPLSEYRTSFTGIISDKSWSLTSVSFYCVSLQSKIDIITPADTYTLTDYPNIYASAIGLPIPIAYGTFTERTAPIVTAVDESDAVANDKVTYNIAGHAIKSITGAWVLYADGADWVQLALDATLASANTYKVDSLTTATITVRFSAGGYAGDTVKVKVAFEGKELSAGVLMDAPSDIVYDLLTTYGDITSTDIDTATFATSKADSSATIAVFLNGEDSMQDIISKICLSDMAYFYVNDSGQFVYRAWSPTTAVGSANSYTGEDLLRYEISFPSENEFEAIRVQYAQAYNTNQTYQSITVHADDVSNIYYISNSRLVNTYLDNLSDSTILAQRLASLHTPPFEIITGEMKWQLADVELGDRIIITVNRIPADDANSPEIFEIISLTKDFTSNTIKFKGVDVRVYGLRVGFWMDGTAPDWATSTATERTQSGYWTDASGYIVPADSTTFNKSLWW